MGTCEQPEVINSQIMQIYTLPNNIGLHFLSRRVEHPCLDSVEELEFPQNFSSDGIHFIKGVNGGAACGRNFRLLE